MKYRYYLLLLTLSSCAAEHVRIRTLEEGRRYDNDRRPIPEGPTRCQQRPGIPSAHN